MMFYRYAPFILLAFALSPALAADEADDRQEAAYETVPLADVLDAVRRKSGRSFLVHEHVQARIVIGQLQARDVDYPALLGILFNNELAAVTQGDVTSIVRYATVRQHPLPVLYEDDDSIADNEWVTRIVTVKQVQVGQLVPILRPLIPQPGHMAAHPDSGMIVIVDRYANTKRLIEMIQRIDAETGRQAG